MYILIIKFNNDLLIITCEFSYYQNQCKNINYILLLLISLY